MNRLLLITILLTGCATVGQKQATCESKFTDFADVVTCTKQETASDPRAEDNAGYKLYILKGEQLAQQVKDKQITDLDARVEWQKLYVELEENETRTKTTTCVPVGNSVTCNTY